VAFVDDQDSVEQVAAQRSDHSFADRVRYRRSRWTGQDPDALRGEDRVECSSEPGVPVAEQELHGGDTVTEVHQEVASGLSDPRPDQMCPAGIVLDRDQCGDHGEKRGVHVHWAVRNWCQVGPDRRDAGSIPASCRTCHTVQGGDPMTEPDQLALHPPVSPGGILGVIRMTMLFDRRSGGRTSRPAACGVVPFPRGQPAVPGQDCGGSDREQCGQRRRGRSRDKASSHARSTGV
jgi:hypothetical protein